MRSNVEDGNEGTYSRDIPKEESIGFDNYWDREGEKVNDDTRISRVITWKITETGKSEIKVILYDNFRFRCENLG